VEKVSPLQGLSIFAGFLFYKSDVPMGLAKDEGPGYQSVIVLQKSRPGGTCQKDKEDSVINP
jgi:hypothetical protein